MLFRGGRCAALQTHPPTPTHTPHFKPSHDCNTKRQQKPRCCLCERFFRGSSSALPLIHSFFLASPCSSTSCLPESANNRSAANSALRAGVAAANRLATALEGTAADASADAAVGLPLLPAAHVPWAWHTKAGLWQSPGSDWPVAPLLSKRAFLSGKVVLGGKAWWVGLVGRGLWGRCIALLG